MRIYISLYLNDDFFYKICIPIFKKSDQIYGASGKILKDKNWNYIYDKQGNLILKTPRNFNNSANNLPKNSSFLSENINSKNNFWIEENEFDRKAEIRRYSKSELKQYDKIRKKERLKILPLHNGSKVTGNTNGRATEC